MEYEGIEKYVATLSNAERLQYQDIIEDHQKGEDDLLQISVQNRKTIRYLEASCEIPGEIIEMLENAKALIRLEREKRNSTLH